MNATAATISGPETYAVVRAFSMTPASAAAVLSALTVNGFAAGRCKRGGLRVTWPGGAARFTDEQGAQPLTVLAASRAIESAMRAKNNGHRGEPAAVADAI